MHHKTQITKLKYAGITELDHVTGKMHLNSLMVNMNLNLKISLIILDV